MNKKIGMLIVLSILILITSLSGCVNKKVVNSIQTSEATGTLKSVQKYNKTFDYDGTTFVAYEALTIILKKGDDNTTVIYTKRYYPPNYDWYDTLSKLIGKQIYLYYVLETTNDPGYIITENCLNCTEKG